MQDNFGYFQLVSPYGQQQNGTQIFESCGAAQVGDSFYRTQVSLGSGLWVPASLSNSVQQLCETLLMLLG